MITNLGQFASLPHDVLGVIISILGEGEKFVMRWVNLPFQYIIPAFNSRKFAFEKNIIHFDFIDYYLRDGSENLVKWAHSIGRPLHFNSLNFASYSGNIKLMGWVMHNIKAEDSVQSTCALAGILGDKKTLNWMRRYKFSWGNVAYFAAKYNNREIILWLKSRKCTSLIDVYCGAVAVCNKLLYEWLLENGFKYDVQNIRRTALETGNADMLDYVAIKCPIEHEDYTELINDSAKIGNINSLNWLESRGIYDDDANPLWFAAQAKNTNYVEVLIERGYKIRLNSTEPIVKCGNKKILSHIVQLFPNIIVDIPTFGRNNITKYYPLKGVVCTGDLELVIWLNNLGLISLDESIELAAMEGHIHILDWLHSQGTRSGCDNIPDQVAYYGKHKVKVLEWLRSYRYPTGRDIKNGKLQYDYDVLIEYARKYDREHKFDGIIV